MGENYVFDSLSLGEKKNTRKGRGRERCFGLAEPQGKTRSMTHPIRGHISCPGRGGIKRRERQDSVSL